MSHQPKAETASAQGHNCNRISNVSHYWENQSELVAWIMTWRVVVLEQHVVVKMCALEHEARNDASDDNVTHAPRHVTRRRLRARLDEANRRAAGGASPRGEEGEGRGKKVRPLACVVCPTSCASRSLSLSLLHRPSPSSLLSFMLDGACKWDGRVRSNHVRLWEGTRVDWVNHTVIRCGEQVDRHRHRGLALFPVLKSPRTRTINVTWWLRCLTTHPLLKLVASSPPYGCSLDIK